MAFGILGLSFSFLICGFLFFFYGEATNLVKHIKRFFPNQNPRKKKKNLWTQILENRERLSDIKINQKIEKTNIFMENPKARNKKE